MKTLTILLLAGMVTVGKAQSNPKIDSSFIWTNNLTVGRSLTIQPPSVHWVVLGLIMTPMYKGKTSGDIGTVDSIKIHISKSQLHWLNDSTAIITKKP